jgi:hypothetical protein
MKTLLLISITAFSGLLFAQSAPQGIKFQGMARDASNNAVSNKSVALRISIIKDQPSGTVVYSESFNTNTNDIGLFGLTVGKGSVIQGVFKSIAWGASSLFLKTEIDLNNGTNYTFLSTTELLSVPYALYAQSAGIDPSQHYVGELWGGGIVVSTYDNGKKGLIMSLNDNASGRVKGITNATKTCTDLTDGSFKDWIIPSLEDWKSINANYQQLNMVLVNDNSSSTYAPYGNWGSIYWTSHKTTSPDNPTQGAVTGWHVYDGLPYSSFAQYGTSTSGVYVTYWYDNAGPSGADGGSGLIRCVRKF